MADLEISFPRPEAMTAAALRAALARGLRHGLDAVEERAKVNVSGRFLKPRTGRLRAKIRTTVAVHGSTIEGRVGTTMWYGRLFERGVGPFVIGPRRKKALRFITAGGRQVFARRIQHPGFSARPWLHTALQESRADITQDLRAEVQLLTREAR